MDLVRLDPLAKVGWPAVSVAVGNFDGVHRGHQALVEAAVREAARLGGTAVVLTFDPHPSRVLSPERAAGTLMTLEQKAEVLSALGIDRLAVLPFTSELARQTPREFAQHVLGEALDARAVAIGSNFRFGRGRGGGPAELLTLGVELGFGVMVLDPVLHRGAAVSSTRVREALEQGEVAAASELLGRPFFLDGEVVPGEGRGRTLGLPTANLATLNEVLPAGGVYACWCLAGPGQGSALRRPAAVNIGRRPTFGGGERTIEAHLLGFEGDLYGRRLRLEFVERLRAEQRFPDVEALRRQIHADIAEARRLLEVGE